MGDSGPGNVGRDKQTKWTNRIVWVLDTDIRLSRGLPISFFLSLSVCVFVYLSLSLPIYLPTYLLCIVLEIGIEHEHGSRGPVTGLGDASGFVLGTQIAGFMIRYG